MKQFLKRGLALLLCLMLFAFPALGEDCFSIDVDALDLSRLNSDDYVAIALSSSAQGIRVRKQLTSSSEVASAVRLTLQRMDTGALLFDKNYGYQSGSFDSGVIYLPYASSGAMPCLVTLYAGDYIYALPFMHLQRRMEANSACTAGVRLSDLDPAQSSDWLMGTMLDLNQLRQRSSHVVDICASNQYVIGTAEIHLSGSRLSVDLRFSSAAEVDVHASSLHVVTDDRVLAQSPAYDPSATVDVGSARYALIYLPMEVSYQPIGLSAFHPSAEESRRQRSLWADAHASISSGAPATSDDGWTDGWDDGWSDGWTSGW